MDDGGYVEWSAGRPLSWSDYWADANPAAYEDAHSHIGYRHAWTVESVESGGVLYFVIAGLELHARLHCRLSWVRGAAASEGLLAHEQGHFDLAEKLRREAVAGMRGMFHGRRFPTRGRGEERRRENARADSGAMISAEVAKLEARLAGARGEYDELTGFGADAAGQRRFDEMLAGLRRRGA